MSIALSFLAGYIAGLFGGASALFFIRAFERRRRPVLTVGKLPTFPIDAPITLTPDVSRGSDASDSLSTYDSIGFVPPKGER